MCSTKIGEDKRLADFLNLLTKVSVKHITSQGQGEEGRRLIMFT